MPTNAHPIGSLGQAVEVSHLVQSATGYFILPFVQAAEGIANR